MISKKQETQSSFVTYISVKDSFRINNELILPKIKFFFDVRNITGQKEIIEGKEISDLDFQTKNFNNFFTHFYEFIVDGIHKEDGEIVIPVTYCITLDKQNCSKTCEKTGALYDEILLYNQPVFYFIYVDIEEIFSFLRNQK